MAGPEFKAEEAAGILDSVMASFDKKQGLERADLADAQQATANIRNSAANYSAVVGQTANETARLLGKQQDARRLADGGLDDVMQLMFKQAFDKDYTQDGRDQTQQAIQTKAAIAGDMHNANVAAETAALQASKARRATDIYNTEAQMQSLKVRVDTMATVSQGIMASEQLRKQQMDSLDRPALDAALGDPLLAASGKITIGGFDYTGRELKARSRDLEVVDMLNSLPLDMASPEYGAAVAAKQKAVMGYMPYNSLIDLRANKGVMDDGTVVDGMVLEQMIATRAKIDQEEYATATADSVGVTLLPNVMQSAYSQIDQLTQVVKPGDPLFGSVSNARLQLGLLMDQANTASAIPGGQAAVLQAVTEVQDQLGKSIDSVALQAAGGDKDLAVIKRSEILGLPVDKRAVTDYVATAFRESRSFGGALPAEEAGKVQSEIDKIWTTVQGEIRDSVAQGDPKPSVEEMRLMREQAARQGMEAYTQKQGLVAANLLPRIAMQTRKDNPIVAAGITADNYIAIESQAATLGENALLQGRVSASGEPLPSNTFALIEAGKYETIGLNATQAEELIQERNLQAVQYEFDLLESVAPGVGTAYAEWLMKNQGQLYDTTMRHPDLATTGPMFRDKFEATARSSASLWAQAAENATGRGEQVMTQMQMKARNPEKMYGILFNMIDSVDDDSKQQVLNQIVLPILKQGQERKLDGATISSMVQNALTVGVEGDPALSKHAQRVLRTLPAVMGQYEMVIDLLTNNKGNISKDEAAKLSGILGPQSGTLTENQRAAGQQWIGGPPRRVTPSFAPRPGLIGDARQQLENNPGGVSAAIEALRNSGN